MPFKILDRILRRGSVKLKKQNSATLEDGPSMDREIMPVGDQPTPEVNERGTWGGKLEFLLACIGFAVGLGNVWRFPYLCYKNGGGAFLIPYLLMLSVLGLPIFYMEFALGQFASLGPIALWNISPLFKGIGHAMTASCFMLTVYYQVIISHAFYYLFASFTSTLPWTSCNNSWNTMSCLEFTSDLLNGTIPQNTVSPPEEYYYKRVLRISGGIDQIGTPSWELTLCLLAGWIICALALSKGVKSLGKVSYFTAIFPYIMLTVLLIRGLTLPGAVDGIIFYLYPDFSRLLDPRVWVEAATQIFFSLSCCNGGLIVMSSFNKFKNNCYRDAVIVAVINFATSIFAGFVIFANLGFMAHEKQTDVASVAQSGPGLAFVVYPEAMTKMPLPPLWSSLFFFMMCTLGFGSQFSLMESVLSAFEDEIKRFGYKLVGKYQIAFRITVCTVCFLLGIPMVCNGGYYLLYLVDNTLSGYPLLIIAVVETLVISYVYGVKNFCRDIYLMIRATPNWFWRICWMFVTPTLSCALVIFLLIAGEEITLEKYRYPAWAVIFGKLMAIFPISLVPIWFLYKYCREGGFILLRELLKPVVAWGPRHHEHREEFLMVIRSEESLKMSKRNNSSMGNLSHAMLNGTQTQMTHGLCGSVISGITLPEEPKFFQSKLSVAEKLTQVHTKEVLKRAASNKDFESLDALGIISASQTALANAAASSIMMYAMSQSNQPSEHPEVKSQEKIETPRFALAGNDDTESQLSDSDTIRNISKL